MQDVTCSSECEFEVVQLELPSGLSPGCGIENLIEHCVPECIDVSAEPLFAIKLLRITSSEHVLVVATEHMISDAASLSILIRDLFAAYSHISSGRAVTWPEKAGSFADYATWQRNALPAKIRNHSEWTEHLLQCRRLRFPPSNAADEADSSWTAATVRIRPEMKIALQSWCRVHQTTLVMCILSAYAATVLRWCNVSNAVIQYQWDGRVSPRDDNVVGFFASILYLLIELEDGDSLLDLQRHVVQRYCDAYEHADFGYVEAQSPRPELCYNTTFNWIPRAPDVAPGVPGSSEAAFTCYPMDFERSLVRYFNRDNEPMTVVLETSEELVVHVCFQLGRFSGAAMDRFAANFLTFVTTLLDRSQTRVKDVMLR
jgi:hypothetical protein